MMIEAEMWHDVGSIQGNQPVAPGATTFCFVKWKTR
jgi:hypothetical protein